MDRFSKLPKVPEVAYLPFFYHMGIEIGLIFALRAAVSETVSFLAYM